MKQPSTHGQVLFVVVAIGLASFFVVAADALLSGCTFLGALVMAGRLSIAGIAFGALAGLAILPTGAPGRWLRLGLAAAIAIPWGSWAGSHLAQTATLSGLAPWWVFSIGAAAVMAVFVAGFLLLSRAASGRRGAAVTIAFVGLLAGPLVYGAHLLADLHKPLAVGAMAAATLALAVPILTLTRRLFPKHLIIAIASLAVIFAASAVFPIGLEDAFAATDKGAVVDLALDLGRVESLPVASFAPEKKRTPGPRVELPVLKGRSVVLISIDALRADHLGYAGYGREVSPFLDRLARESVIFERAHSASPCSSLSIPSLVAGRFMEPFLRSGVDLPSTAADRFGAMGYRTLGFYPEKVFSAGPGLMGAIRQTRFGFQTSSILEQREAGADLEVALAALREEEGRPVFLWVHLYDPHLPYDCHDRPFGNLPMDCYDAEILNVDRRLEAFVASLEEILEEPVIAVTADHGEAFGEHGRLYHSTDLHEEQIRVPMLIKVPGIEPSRISTPVSNTELVGCLERLVSDRREGAGNDVFNLLADAEAETGSVFAAVKSKRTLIDGSSKIICNGWPDGPCAFYELDRDPGEQRNMAGRKPGEVARLLAALGAREQRVLEELGDTMPRPIILGRLDRMDVAGELATLARDGGAHGGEATRLLAMFRDEGLSDVLEELQSSKNREVAAWACVGSSLLDDGCRVVAVAGFAGRDDDLGSWSAVALGREGDPRGYEPLLKILESEDPGLRAEAAIALGRLGDHRAVPGLIRLLDVKQSRWAAIDALGELGDRRAEKRLRELMKDDPDESNIPRYERAIEAME